jgi:hypothetical protein
MLKGGYETAKEVLAEKSTTEEGGNETLNEEAEVESDVKSKSDEAKSDLAFSPRRHRKKKEKGDNNFVVPKSVSVLSKLSDKPDLKSQSADAISPGVTNIMKVTRQQRRYWQKKVPRKREVTRC